MAPFYAVILDAGSSSTRGFIYHITPKDIDVQYAKVTEVVNNSGNAPTSPIEKGGIHKLKTDDDVKEHLDDVFEDIVALLPDKTPFHLYLLATAGVRDLLNSEERKALHTLLSKYLRGQEARLGLPQGEYAPITGTDEAKFGWIAGNYLQGRPYNAGYVEMGGASAQIAFPLIAAGTGKTLEDLCDQAKNAEKLLNMPTMQEMAKLYWHDGARMMEIDALMKGEKQVLENAVKRWAGLGMGRFENPNSEEVYETMKRWAGLGIFEVAEVAKLEELEELVKVWGGDLAYLKEVVEREGARVNGMAKLRAVEVHLEQFRKAELSRKAHVEKVGQQTLFLASYPLGANEGYKAYKTAMLNRARNSKDKEVKDLLGEKKLYDPSKHDGYSKVEKVLVNGKEEEMTIFGKSTVKKPMSLMIGPVLKALRLDEFAAARVLDPIHHKLHFIGAANFWWSMKEAGKEDGDFSLANFNTRRDKRNSLPYNEFRRKYYRGKKDWEIEILDKETFTSTWALLVLAHAFGLRIGSDKDSSLTFTPYNGPDRNRFSWTLGKALLLASDNLEDLLPPPLQFQLQLPRPFTALPPIVPLSLKLSLPLPLGHPFPLSLNDQTDFELDLEVED